MKTHIIQKKTHNRKWSINLLGSPNKSTNNFLAQSRWISQYKGAWDSRNGLSKVRLWRFHLEPMFIVPNAQPQPTLEGLKGKREDICASVVERKEKRREEDVQISRHVLLKPIRIIIGSFLQKVYSRSHRIQINEMSPKDMEMNHFSWFSRTIAG